MRSRGHLKELARRNKVSMYLSRQDNNLHGVRRYHVDFIPKNNRNLIVENSVYYDPNNTRSPNPQLFVGSSSLRHEIDGAPPWDIARNSLSIGQLKDAIKKVKRMFPKAGSISGIRETGIHTNPKKVTLSSGETEISFGTANTSQTIKLKTKRGSLGKLGMLAGIGLPYVLGQLNAT